jgi:hypothetical protein
LPDQTVFDDAAKLIEAACPGVDVVQVTGSGLTRFIEFTGRDGTFVGGHESDHYVFDVTTSDGTTYTVHAQVIDWYDFVDGAFVLRATTGRDPFVEWVGRTRVGGIDSGHAIDPCPA